MNKPARVRDHRAAAVRSLEPGKLAGVIGGGDTLKTPEQLAGDTTKTPFDTAVWSDDWLVPV